MIPNRCMYFHALNDNSAQDLVLTCEDESWHDDKDFVRYPGIYCYYEEFVRGNGHQMWYWDDKTGYLTDGKHGFFLVNDHGILMLADPMLMDKAKNTILDDSFPK